MIKPFYEQDGITIYHGDCREILPQLDVKVDLVLTDPPYPDFYITEYRYDVEVIRDVLTAHDCRQLVFWSARTDFPLPYTAIHIWNKNPSNTGAQYERIFERNGNHHFKVFTYYMVNSTVAANMTHDIFNEHPSQKPKQLISKLITDFSDDGNLILDPFLGSGTTAVAAKILGRKCIGIEIEEKYCEIAVKRLAQSVMRLE